MMVLIHIFTKSFYFSGIMQQDNSEQVIIDPVLIAKHYIRTWFFLDLLSSIPLDYIFLIFSAGSNVINHIYLLLSNILYLLFFVSDQKKIGSLITIGKKI